MVTWDPVEQEGEGDHMEEVGVGSVLNFSAFRCSKLLDGGLQRDFENVDLEEYEWVEG